MDESSDHVFVGIARAPIGRNSTRVARDVFFKCTQDPDTKLKYRVDDACACHVQFDLGDPLRGEAVRYFEVGLQF